MQGKWASGRARIAFWGLVKLWSRGETVVSFLGSEGQLLLYARL